MRRIKYFCYYHYKHGDKSREGVQAASTKIDYIVDVLNRNGYVVDIISMSGITKKGFNFDVGGITAWGGGNTLRHFLSFGKIRSVFRVPARWLTNVHFFLWTLLHVKHGEQIIVYHSLGYCTMFNLLKKFKGFRVIGEIEEIYQDVHSQSDSVRKAELDFVSHCDKYIFPTQLLNEKFNIKGKPFVVVHGVYSVAQKRAEKFRDGKIHVVYGGTFDPNKGGAAAAAAAAAYLPDSYHVHICGFGTQIDTELIRHTIEETNKKGGATVTFEGLLYGEDYTRFIQQCHIGLSTQNPTAAFNGTSFPSKILVYLSNGLSVVSIRIPAIATSAVVDTVWFYDEQTPQKIAEAIMQVPTDNSFLPATLLQRLDRLFSDNFKKMLQQ